MLMVNKCDSSRDNVNVENMFHVPIILLGSREGVQD